VLFCGGFGLPPKPRSGPLGQVLGLLRRRPKPPLIYSACVWFVTLRVPLRMNVAKLLSLSAL